MPARSDFPWIERPTIILDADVPIGRRFENVPVDAVDHARELLSAIRAELPAGALKLANLVRARTANRFQSEFVALAKMIAGDWREVLLANVSYDLVLSSFGCSTLALPTASGPVLARNMDWWPEEILARCSYIMRWERGGGGDGSLDFCNVGWPGAVGLVTGLSGRGFALALNAVVGPENSNRLGYPVLLHLRRVIEDAKDFDDALQRLTNQTLAAPALITLVGVENEQRVVIERSPRKSAVRWGEENSALITTNDYRVLFKTETHDFSEIYRTTCSRYDALCRFFADVDSARDVPDEQLLYVLTDDSVIQGITAQHVIIRPKTQSVRLFVPRRLTPEEPNLREER